MKDFYEKLIEYLEYKGYEPLKSREGIILAERKEQDQSSASEDHMELLEIEKVERISLVIAGDVVHEDDLLKLEESEEHTILVVTEEPSKDILNSIPDHVEVWDREKLIKMFGEMVLEKSFAEGVIEGEEGIKGPKDEFVFDIEHEGRERILEMVIDFKEVSRLGEKLVKGFKYPLELVPHYFFSYSIDRGDSTEKGKLYLNAVSGRPNFWENHFKSMHEMKRSHIKLEPNISREESGKRALKSIKNRYGQRKEKRWEEGGTTIVEKEYEKPANEDIKFRRIGMIYVPMWAIEGTDGIVVINAARGKIESVM